MSPLIIFKQLSAVVLVPALTMSSAFCGDGLARESGARLLETCRHAQSIIIAKRIDPAIRPDALLCIGFIEGFIWGHGWSSWHTVKDPFFCPPEGFGYRQAVPVVVSYLEAHPERLIQRAHLLVFAALSNGFPCDL